MYQSNLENLGKGSRMRSSLSHFKSTYLSVAQRFLIIFFMLFQATACQEVTLNPPQPFEPLSLKILMEKIAYQATQVHLEDTKALNTFRQQILSPLILSTPELLKMLQPKGGKPSPKVLALIERYEKILVPAFLKEAPSVFAHAWQSSLTLVQINRVGPSRGELNMPGDLKLLEALPKRPPLYHVRYLPKSTQGSTSNERGLRLNGFIYTPSGWKTFLKLGESLEEWRSSDLKAKQE